MKCISCGNEMKSAPIIFMESEMGLCEDCAREEAELIWAQEEMGEE